VPWHTVLGTCHDVQARRIALGHRTPGVLANLGSDRYSITPGDSHPSDPTCRSSASRRLNCAPPRSPPPRSAPGAHYHSASAQKFPELLSAVRPVPTTDVSTESQEAKSLSNSLLSTMTQPQLEATSSLGNTTRCDASAYNTKPDGVQSANLTLPLQAAQR
jgi:hypothetical protein